MNSKLKLFLAVLITSITTQITHSNFLANNLRSKLYIATKAQNLKKTIHTKAIVNYTNLNYYAASNPILASLLVSSAVSIGLNFLIDDYKAKKSNQTQPYGLPLNTFNKQYDNCFDRV